LKPKSLSHDEEMNARTDSLNYHKIYFFKNIHQNENNHSLFFFKVIIEQN